MGRTRNARKIQIDVPKGLLIGIVLGVIAILVASILLGGGEFIRSSWTRFERSSSPFDSTHSTDATNASTLEQLQIALAAEVQARRELAARIAKLDDEFSLLRDLRDEAVASRSAQDEPLAQGAVPDTDGSETHPNADVDVKISGFDDDELLSRGIHPSEVARLRDLWESHELDRATVTDLALREGWFFQQPHRAELARLDRELRENLSDEDYDRYLYARGEPNQIRVGEVFKGSSASRAGMRPGDVILRYDDVRIFQPGVLLRTSSLGELGERVAVAIDRDGVRMILYVERGPLGAMTQHRRGPPGLD